MKLTAWDYISAARFPEFIGSMRFGDWRLDRAESGEGHSRNQGFSDYVCLRHLITPEKIDYSNMHLVNDDGTMWDVVMEDSTSELQKHLPIWMKAKGHVLKTGLGLGCVVRGLLIKPEVTQVTVIEIDPDIAQHIGAQFKCNPKVNVILADALEFDYSTIPPVDYAWHDIWTPENKGLQVKHAKLLTMLGPKVAQGAWAMPRQFKRLFKRRIAEYLG